MTHGRVAIIGLDGATYRVLDPMVKAGAMPALARLQDVGAHTTLRSTIPTYTPPAWVSMATGVNPGRHGVFGFLATTPQQAPEITHSGMIGAPALWDYLSELGFATGVFNVPMTYPPMKVNGFMVSGGLAAGWTQPELPNFTSDTAIGRIVSTVGGDRYPVDTVVHYETDWKSPAMISRIEHVQRQRRAVLGAILQDRDVDFLFAVFEGPDRLLHLHYQYIVECSDWFGHRSGGEARDRAMSYFQELDRAIEDLVSWVGSNGHVLIVSDHGFGPWEKTVNVNLLLERWGYLTLPSVSRLTRSRLIAGVGQRLSHRLLPRRLLHRMKARVERGIQWQATRAFASHVSEQGVHINTRQSHPRGIVEPDEVGGIERELIERFHELRDPDDGAPVTDAVVARDSVIRGPFAPRAPELFPLCRDQRYELSDTLAARTPVTDHRDRPWGYHHRDGIFVAAGPGVERGMVVDQLDIVDVVPTAFHLASLPVPQGLDGHIAMPILSPAAIARPIISAALDPAIDRSAEYPFSPEEEAAIEESLRGLGYIE